MRVAFVGGRLLPRGAAARLRRTMARIGAELGIGDSEVAVLFTRDAAIRELNARWRRVDEPTDVLSFPADEPARVGDIAISIDRARAQAGEIGHSVEDELEVLLLHGMLHLLGHDHETDRGKMRRIEARVAAKVLGSALGLVERSSRRGA